MTVKLLESENKAVLDIYEVLFLMNNTTQQRGLCETQTRTHSFIVHLKYHNTANIHRN